MEIFLLLLAFIGVLALGRQYLLLVYKNSYYEETLKNHKEKFTPERWNQIEQVMNKKSPFK